MISEELKSKIANANEQNWRSIEVEELDSTVEKELTDLGYFIYRGSLHKDHINTIISWAHKPKSHV